MLDYYYYVCTVNVSLCQCGKNHEYFFHFYLDDIFCSLLFLGLFHFLHSKLTFTFKTKQKCLEIIKKQQPYTHNNNNGSTIKYNPVTYYWNSLKNSHFLLIVQQKCFFSILLLLFVVFVVCWVDRIQLRAIFGFQLWFSILIVYFILSYNLLLFYSSLFLYIFLSFYFFCLYLWCIEVSRPLWGFSILSHRNTKQYSNKTHKIM